MKENYIFIALLIILVIVACVHLKQPNNESFDGTHSWRYTPQDYNIVSQDYLLNPSTRNIVGPNYKENTLNNWQYNPQRTLVNYHYYKDNDDLGNFEDSNENRKTQQLDPITNSDTGKTLQSTIINVKTPDNLNITGYSGTQEHSNLI